MKKPPKPLTPDEERFNRSFNKAVGEEFTKIGIPDPATAFREQSPKTYKKMLEIFLRSNKITNEEP